MALDAFFSFSFPPCRRCVVSSIEPCILPLVRAVVDVGVDVDVDVVDAAEIGGGRGFVRMCVMVLLIGGAVATRIALSVLDVILFFVLFFPEFSPFTPLCTVFLLC